MGSKAMPSNLKTSSVFRENEFSRKTSSVSAVSLGQLAFGSLSKFFSIIFGRDTILYFDVCRRNGDEVLRLVVSELP